MAKKKFIDKKTSATFRLVYKDYSTFPYAEGSSSSDRVFTRVDGGTGFIPGFSEDHNHDSIFADASEDDDEEDEEPAASCPKASHGGSSLPPPADSCFKANHGGSSGPLPEHLRKELVELGFPDDGYNYLQHLREIGPSGNFFPNSKASLHLPRPDFKAYDATRLDIHSSRKTETSDLNVSSQVSPFRNRESAQRSMDPEVSALLEATDGSQFGSADELEDDFIAKANEQAEEENAGVLGYLHDAEDGEPTVENSEAKERPKRLLDEQFDLLAMREYNDEDSEADYDEYLGPDEHAPISGFDTALSDFLIESSLPNVKYQTPADLEGKHIQDKTITHLAGEEKHQSINLREDITLRNRNSDKPFSNVQRDFLLRNYESEQDKEVILFEDDSDDNNRKWDCETVISTLSNLDNHPAKISAPVSNRRDKWHSSSHEQTSAGMSVIRLRGRNQLPVDFLPGRTGGKERVEKHESGNLRPNDEKIHGNCNRQPLRIRAGETRDAKKFRKAMVKEEKRNARLAKKELKQLYRGESRRAQHDAAFTGLSVIPLK